MRLNRVHDTLNLDHGQLAQRAVLVVYRNEQELVMHQDGKEEWTARILDLISRREYVKLNLALSMETGDHGHHGVIAVKRVVLERNGNQENVTTPSHNLEERDVQDTIRFTPIVISSHVQSTVDGPTTDHGYLAINLVEEVFKRRSENVPTQNQDTEERNAQVPQSQLGHVTLTIAQSMEVGRNGECGENAARLVVVEGLTECDLVPSHHPNMAESVAQEHQSKPNNVAPSNVQSMVTGMHLALILPVLNRAVLVNKSVPDIVMHQLLNTTVSLAQVLPRRAGHVTQNHAPFMVSTPTGLDSVHVRTPVEVEARLDTEHAYHRNMAAILAVYLVALMTCGNATPTCAQ